MCAQGISFFIKTCMRSLEGKRIPTLISLQEIYATDAMVDWGKRIIALNFNNKCFGIALDLYYGQSIS